MRIHTNLKKQDMYGALKNSGAPIDFETLSEHASKTHDRAFEVRLSGTGGKNNTGLYGSGDYSGADWDEWGAFFGALYDLDPEARCGGTQKQPVYADRDDYHYKTGDRFKARGEAVDGEPRKWNYLPADTHPRHRWEYLGSWDDHGTSGFACTKCSATRPPSVPRNYAA